MGQEKNSIDAFKFFDNPQSMDLQVLTNVGNEFQIHPDQVRQWGQVGGEFGAKLLALGSLEVFTFELKSGEKQSPESNNETISV